MPMFTLSSNDFEENLQQQGWVTGLVKTVIFFNTFLNIYKTMSKCFKSTVTYN